MIIKEKYEAEMPYNLLIIIGIALFSLLGHFNSRLHIKEQKYEELLVVLWVPIGAVTCYILNIHYQLGSVIAAGVVGTTASFLPTVYNKSLYLKKIPHAIYCGAFVGMSSIQVAPTLTFIIYASTVAGILLLLSKSVYVGVGGKLGTIAFGSVVLVSSIHWLIR